VLGGARQSAGTILDWAQSAHCVLCDGLTRQDQTLCAACAARPQVAACALQLRLGAVGRQLDALVQHCMRCAGLQRQAAVECRSLDCPHLYTRLKLSRQLRTAEGHAATGIAELSMDF
jgi:hypothetical protein